MTKPSKPTRQILNSLGDCTCFNMRKASRTVTQVFDEALQPSGLRATQFSLLAALYFSGPVGVGDLSRELVMDRTTLTRNLKPLAAQNLVRSVPGEDRRTRALSLTSRGKKTLLKALPLWEEAQARVIRRLSRNTWKDLLKHLRTTVDALGSSSP